MDLFVVNRYMGDDEDEDKVSKEEKELKKLSLLKEHIEKRKRTAVTLDVKDQEETPTSKKTKKVKLKDKKRKSSVSHTDDTQEEQILEEQNRQGNRDTEITSQNTITQRLKDESSLEESSFTVIGGKNKKEEANKVLKTLPEWLSKPMIIETDLSANLLSVQNLKCLTPHTVKQLRFLGIKSLFPVQKAVIPAVLDTVHQGSLFCLGGDKPSDICVSAPTGSGKTLSYVVPIVQMLASYKVCLLQALILLPTKDLACQVKEVFDAFIEGTSLKVGLACGNKAFAKEQESLIGQRFGSSSRVNILVATPGRLVEHLSSTPYFTLQHLRFLVIDEADRLLDQSYHDWLNRVLKVTYEFQQEITDPRTSLMNNESIMMNLHTRREPPSASTPAEFSKLHFPLQKLLFSATMTNSPEKLALLNLYNPKLFIASQSSVEQSESGTITGRKMISRYTVPHGLLEYMVICNSGEKPLMLLYLMTQMSLSGVLCFTSSLEATHRLFLLVSHFGSITVAEYSSSLNAQQRHGVLRDFRQGQIQLLICSDAMARGMDIDNVSYVISYDTPKHVKSYIHRVGRTARAGNEGTAYTLLYSEQVHHFKELIRKTGRDKIPKHTVKDTELQPLVDRYQTALQLLEQTVVNEKGSVEQGMRRKGQEVV